MKDESPKQRPFIGVLFECCHVYTRVYANKERTAFVGWCPKCAKKLEVEISPTGSTERIFRAR